METTSGGFREPEEVVSKRPVAKSVAASWAASEVISPSPNSLVQVK